MLVHESIFVLDKILNSADVRSKILASSDLNDAGLYIVITEELPILIITTGDFAKSMVKPALLHVLKFCNRMKELLAEWRAALVNYRTDLNEEYVK